MPRFRPAALAIALLALLAHLATGPAAGSVTSTKPVKQPPYYRGETHIGGVAGRLPVEVVLPAGLPKSWLPVAALERLAADMEQWLAGRQLAQPLVLEAGSGKPTSPSVYLGCALDQLTGECSEEERSNVLAVTGGSKDWRRVLRDGARLAGVDRALVVRLEVAPHWVRQKGLKGSKQVALGTDHLQELPWLSSLDTPVWVLQVTGAVVDAEGELVRSGAEGIWALRTPFRASALGAQKLLTEEDVELVRAELRRSDLPGAPLSWEVALRQLTRQLLGEEAVLGSRLD